MKTILLLMLGSICFVSGQTFPIYHMEANRISMPFDNYGTVAAVYSDGALTYDQYDSLDVLYSGGFIIGGKNGGRAWVNGNFASARGLDGFRPGRVSDAPEDTLSGLYRLKSSDAAFSESWEMYKQAVDRGALFYDGDNDGLYNPVDKNGNGVWDTNEDRPDLIGDITLWCVYNDGVPREERHPDVSGQPEGVEIRQTIFAWSMPDENALANVFFIRYRLINSGLFDDVLDSVYFSPAIDPDICSYQSNYAAYDADNQAGYGYASLCDGADYGACVYIDVLSTGQEYIPGVTYVDNNSNNIFDEGDSALNSAEIMRGPHLGVESVQGARPVPLNAFRPWGKYYDQPRDSAEIRRYLVGGLDENGETIDPCTYWLGNGDELENCAELNPMFLYTGDPLSGSGWLLEYSDDIRLSFSSGPFRLEKGNPVEITIAYIFASSSSTPLQAIEQARNYDAKIQNFYDSNFTDIPSNININESNKLAHFRLQQNYPNPFNPSTTIVYELPRREQVKIEIFDSAGRRVATLFDAPQNPGRHELSFNAAHLASGVYYYRLRAGQFVQTKKMLLIK